MTRIIKFERPVQPRKKRYEPDGRIIVCDESLVLESNNKTTFLGSHSHIAKKILAFIKL